MDVGSTGPEILTLNYVLCSSAVVSPQPIVKQISLSVSDLVSYQHPDGILMNAMVRGPSAFGLAYIHIHKAVNNLKVDIGDIELHEPIVSWLAGKAEQSYPHSQAADVFLPAILSLTVLSKWFSCCTTWPHGGQRNHGGLRQYVPQNFISRNKV